MPPLGLGSVPIPVGKIRINPIYGGRYADPAEKSGVFPYQPAFTSRLIQKTTGIGTLNFSKIPAAVISHPPQL